MTDTHEKVDGLIKSKIQGPLRNSSLIISRLEER